MPLSYTSFFNISEQEAHYLKHCFEDLIERHIEHGRGFEDPNIKHFDELKREINNFALKLATETQFKPSKFRTKDYRLVLTFTTLLLRLVVNYKKINLNFLTIMQTIDMLTGSQFNGDLKMG